MKEYEQYLEQGKEIATLNGIFNLLIWDQEVYMPKGSIDSRSSQIALLAHMIHEKKIGKPFKKALEKLLDIETGKLKKKKFTDIQKLTLHKAREDFLKQTKLPSSFVKKFSETTSLALQVWAKAKKENDFSAFMPTLEKIIRLNQEKAEILGYKNHPYDALVDIYEPEMTTERLETLFTSLEQGLQTLVKKIASKNPVNDTFLFQHFSREKQILFGNLILEHLNINQEHLRLDESIHPFSIAMHPTDSRITTKIEENNVMSSISSILHETGHGLYEANLPQEYYGTPLCEAMSLGIHESQSRIFETFLGKSRSFWEYFYPHMQRIFTKELSSISFEDFYQAIHKVKPGLIRVDADEITYCLHILLRFDLEKSLIEGSLSVKDLPEAWNAKMQSLLGIMPENDREGCMQDNHWAGGDFGYFPTYALGNLYAAHFFKGFSEAHPNWKQGISVGDFSAFKEFLKNKIHSKGRMLSQEELALHVTGSPLSEKTYLNYLEKKYL